MFYAIDWGRQPFQFNFSTGPLDWSRFKSAVERFMMLGLFHTALSAPSALHESPDIKQSQIRPIKIEEFKKKDKKYK